MITHIATTQELTLQLYESEDWEYFLGKDMSRDQIFNMVDNWARVFEKAHKDWPWDGDYYDEIDRFLKFCVDENRAGRFPTAKSFMQKRITIGFCVTECGHPVAGTLEFPKRGEDMDHGSEYEWYYSLKEIQDDILKLKVGETIPFKIRDDKDSVGSVTRLK